MMKSQQSESCVITDAVMCHQAWLSEKPSVAAGACVLRRPDITLQGRKCTDSTNWLRHCLPCARAALSVFGGMEEP